MVKVVFYYVHTILVLDKQTEKAEVVNKTNKYSQQGIIAHFLSNSGLNTGVSGYTTPA